MDGDGYLNGAERPLPNRNWSLDPSRRMPLLLSIVLQFVYIEIDRSTGNKIYLPMFFAILDVELLLDSQSGTQTPPKSVVVEDGVKHHLRVRYKNSAKRRTTKPATAPRNAVAFTGTVNRSTMSASERNEPPLVYIIYRLTNDRS